MLPFTPLVLESYGAFGIGTVKLVNSLTRHYNQTLESGGVQSTWRFDKWACAVLSVQLQKGNSRLISAALERCRAASA